MAVYILLSLFPVFLSPNLAMNYLTGYIPNLNPIGNDLTVMVDLIQGVGRGERVTLYYPVLSPADLHPFGSVTAYGGSFSTV